MTIDIRNLVFTGLSASVIACGPVTATSAPSAGETATAADSPDAATPHVGGNGEFISRVFATGEVAPIDPILAPNATADHTHMFFGANNVTPTSTRTQLFMQPTSAKNPSDTAAYWVPQLFFHDQPWAPGCTGSPQNLTCGTDPDTTINLRVYYTATQPGPIVQLPRAMMVTGYPKATRDPHLDEKSSMTHVFYHCGVDTGAGLVTPRSAWPYTCTPYAHDGFDGVIMVVEFPECWNGHVSGSMNGERMVQYIDPAVATGYDNDLAYPKNGSCPDGFTLHVPSVSIHVHSKIDNPSSDGSTILPSKCDDQKGFSFTCTSQGEPGEGSIALGLSSDAGTPGAWYTMHADFVQSWHMGAVDDPFSQLPPPDQDAHEHPGTLNDLTEDCLNAGVVCSFQPDKNSTFIGG